MRRIEVITGDEHDRGAVAPGVIDGHAGMLDADRAVRSHCQWLTGHLVVAVPHRNGVFLVRAGQKLRFRVATVVDEGFLQAAEARARIRRNVIDIEAPQHIDHVVGAGAVDKILIVLVR